jgi:hypothetical protein
MSHKVTIDLQFKNLDALSKTCEELGIPCVTGEKVTAAMYGGLEEGVARFRPQGWQYDVVVKADGTAVFDNFGGRWGEEESLDRVRQGYAVNVAKTHVQQKGLRVLDQSVTADGRVRIRAGK